MWENFPDALLRLSGKLHCTEANLAARLLFALPPGRAEPHAEFCARFTLAPALAEAARRVMQSGRAERGEFQVQIDDRRVWLDVWLIPASEAAQVVLAMRDISRSKQSEERLRGAAELDSVTGLLNHATFHEEVVRTLRQAQTLGRQPALILFDLDYLKNINDVHGHRVGDQAIQLMAETLRSATRSGDALGRLGGDEFGWLVPDASDLPAVVRLAQRMLSAIQRVRLVPGVFLSASVGVAGLVSTYEPGDLFDRADAAVYDAKAAGRGVVAVAGATEIGYESRRHLQDEPPADPAPDLSAARDVAAAARAALREWVNVMAVSGGCIDLLDQTHGWVQACAYYRFGHDDWTLSTQVYRLDDYPSTAAAIAERRPYTCRVDDPEADPAEQALLRERGFASLLLTPLVAQERVLGIVELFDTRHRIFTATDQRMVLALARHLAALLALLER